MLERLVAFDTESAKSNLPLIDFVEDYLKGWDVPPPRAERGGRQGGDLRDARARGPRRRRALRPYGRRAGDGAVLDERPFTLRVADGRAYGRGAVDMKGFDALALALVPDLHATDLKTPIHILLSYDEETTCLGVMDTIARFGRRSAAAPRRDRRRADELEVVDAHKSIATFFTTVHGHEAHSSKPALGANAVMAAAELVCELTRIADAMIARGDPSGRFDPPYTTVHVGTINGGTARNILPKSCVFHWEFRGLPDLDPTRSPTALQRFADEVALPRLNRHGPFGRSRPSSRCSFRALPRAGLRGRAAGAAACGPNATATVPFATEAGRFQGAGIATIVCGPGSIDQAHQPDEYITLEDLAAGEAFMRRLAEHCTRG